MPLRVRFAVAAVITSVLASVLEVSPAAAATVESGAAAAVRYGARHRVTSAIAVADTRTGALYTAGNPSRLYPAASVAKTLIATRVLLEGRMHGHNATLAWRMITRSDNASAYALYAQVGRAGLLPWLARHYRIADLGAPETQHGRWGSTLLTARGLARFYAAIRRDRLVWPWLSRAMHAYAATSTEGEPNAFGIAAAAPRSAVKNGWATGRDVRDLSRADLHTTGFVDGDRYAVVILSSAPGSLYYLPGERVVTREAELVMPGGRITPIPPPVVASLSARSAPTRGSVRLTITGSGFTRDTTVRFGPVAGRAVRVLSSTRLRVTSPAHPAGRVAVQVVSPYGTSAPRLRSSFTYVAAPGISALSISTSPVTGGQLVTITGSSFLHVRGVRFGTTAAQDVRVLSPSRLEVTTPAHAAGSAGVVVSSSYGLSAAAPFDYVEPPPP